MLRLPIPSPSRNALRHGAYGPSAILVADQLLESRSCPACYFLAGYVRRK